MSIIIGVVLSFTLVPKIKIDLLTPIPSIRSGVFQRALQIPIVVLVLLRIVRTIPWNLYRIEEICLLSVPDFHTRTLLEHMLSRRNRIFVIFLIFPGVEIDAMVINENLVVLARIAGLWSIELVLGSRSNDRFLGIAFLLFVEESLIDV